MTPCPPPTHLLAQARRLLLYLRHPVTRRPRPGHGGGDRRAQPGPARLHRSRNAGFPANHRRQELAAHRDADAVALGIGLALQVHVEVDHAHDAVAALLVDKFLEGRAVGADQPVKALDPRVGRHAGGQAALARHDRQPLFLPGAPAEDPGHDAGLFNVERHLARHPPQPRTGPGITTRRSTPRPRCVPAPVPARRCPTRRVGTGLAWRRCRSWIRPWPASPG